MNELWAMGGESHCAPRDTFPAYWGGIGAGADALVVTVQRTVDGVLVCAPSDALPDGSTRISTSSAADVARVDAGQWFRSQDDGGVEGSDRPWIGHAGKDDALYHPGLDEFLVHVGRRIPLVVRVATGAVASGVLGLLDRFGLRGRAIVLGQASVLATITDAPYRRALALDANASSAQAVELAASVRADTVVMSATEALAGVLAIRTIVTPDGESRTVPQPHVEALRDRVAGFAVGAVSRTRAQLHALGLIFEESFAGTRVDSRYWVLGNSRPNADAKIRVEDGLRIDIQGTEYSGAAAFTTFSIPGDFDARMDFVVEHPSQGTTFELAALHIDAGYQRPNLTFDVHGAPPYASSERDEDDGFRIGWNNGPALTRWVDNEPQSSNLYNNYSRDVGYAAPDSPAGSLRLTRHGDVFNAYYTDHANPGWVLSGSCAVPALGPAVFLRLAAKHWPKGGRPAPSNAFRFTNFTLHQW